jgi:FMN reductase
MTKANREPRRHTLPRATPLPHIVGIGGTVRPGSSSEQALRIAVGAAEDDGATTRIFAGAELAQLPMYSPEESFRSPVARELVEHLRNADGVIVASPGYHGSISGLVKNALDYTEDMRDDGRPYLTDRSVGLLVTAYGWQASVTTLEALRSIVHALRGWVTPFGAAINSSECRFLEDSCDQPKVTEQLALVGSEVMRFARMVALERDADSRAAGERETNPFRAVATSR